MNRKMIFIFFLGVFITLLFWYFGSRGQIGLEEKNNTVQNDTVGVENLFTPEEVSKHNKKEDCWMIIDSDVLDVTSFIDKHPGGEVIINGCGKDASSYFHSVNQHLKPLVKMVYQKMIIGKVSLK